MRTPVRLLLLLAALGCSEVPATNPFDPSTPPSQQATATLSGHLTLPPGWSLEHLAGARVSLALGANVGVDDEGAFWLEGLAPGNWDLEVEARSFVARPQAVAVPLAAQVGLGGVGLEPRPGHQISGLVRLDGRGTGDHGGVLVRVKGTPLQTLTEADGTWSIAVPPGRFALDFERAGYGSVSAAAVEVEDASVALSEPTVLPALVGHLRVSLKLQPAWLPVDERYLDVTLRGTTEASLESRRLVAGEAAELGPLPAGIYILEAQRAGFRAAGELIEITGDAQAEVELEAEVVDLLAARLDLRGTRLERADLDAAAEAELRFEGADLNEVDLAGVDLVGLRLGLRGVSLRRAALAGARLDGLDLGGVDLFAADLEGVTLTGAVLTDANLTRANLRGATLGVAEEGEACAERAGGIRLEGAELDGVDLSGATLQAVDLRGARLEGARLSDARLEWACLDGADLSQGDLSGAQAGAASFVGADLSRGDLSDLRAPSATFDAAELSQTDLRRARLGAASFVAADLVSALLNDADLRLTRMDEVNLSNAVLDGADLGCADQTATPVDCVDRFDGGIRPLPVDGTRVGLCIRLRETDGYQVDLEAGETLRASVAYWQAGHLSRYGAALKLSLEDPEGVVVREEVAGRLVAQVAAAGRYSLFVRAEHEPFLEVGAPGPRNDPPPELDLPYALTIFRDGERERSQCTSLRGATLNGVVMVGANLSNCDLRDASLLGVVTGTATEAPTIPPFDCLLEDQALPTFQQGLARTRRGADGPFDWEGHDAGCTVSATSLYGADLSGANLGSARLEGLDLRGARLVGVDLRSAAFDRAVLAGADLRDADLRDATLVDSTLDAADLSGADLRHTDLRAATIFAADLSGVRGDGARFGESWLLEVTLRGAELAGVDFAASRMRGVDFSEADLERADLTEVVLTGGLFHGVQARRVLLTEADLDEAEFDDANLQQADLGGAYVTGGRFEGATLSSANADQAEFEGVDFRGASLSNATFGEAGFTEVDLRCLHRSLEGLHPPRLEAARLLRSRLDGADLRGARLEGALFADTDLRAARLGMARMAGSRFTGADLRGADLTGALSSQAEGTRLDRATTCPNGAPPEAIFSCAWGHPLDEAESAECEGLVIDPANREPRPGQANILCRELPGPPYDPCPEAD